MSKINCEVDWEGHHQIDPCSSRTESSSSTILSIMRIQKWTMAAAMAASFGQAQVPIDSRPTVPAVIPDSVSVEANIPYDHYKETGLDILQPKAPSKEKRPGG